MAINKYQLLLIVIIAFPFMLIITVLSTLYRLIVSYVKTIKSILKIGEDKSNPNEG